MKKLANSRISCILVLSVFLSFSSCNNVTHQTNGKDAPINGLKEYTDIPLGCAISIYSLQKDEKLKSLIISNFNSITSGNDMKMYSFISKEGNYDWKKADDFVEFGIENKQRIFGHTLVWHFGAPKWIQENAAEKGSAWLDTFLKDYIHTVVGRYKGKVAAWDVINEGFETQGGAYRQSFFYNTMGKEYIAKAFQYAHEADPHAELFYNDFNIERDTAKLHGVLRMINELKENNIPITGLGLQMHIRMDIPDEVIAYSLKKAVETGLKIHLSEVDIIFNKHDDTQGGGVQIVAELTDSMRAAQAEKYKNLVLMYRTLVPKEQQYGITFWGCNDRDSWIKSFFSISDWPTIFDENLKPKPAYYGFIEGLKETI